MNNFIYYDYANSQICKVKENQSTYLKSNNIQNYLNKLCLENGSTLQGRKDSYKYLMHQKKFIPILVHETLIYFPTKATKAPDCIWINYFSIDYVVYTKKTCTIYFHDHTCLTCSHPKRIQHSLLSIQQYIHFF